MFKTTAIDTLKQDKKCQACWYIILSTMSGSTTTNEQLATILENETKVMFGRALRILNDIYSDSGCKAHE